MSDSKLFFDTDCISAFLWVGQEAILPKLYPGRIVIPEPVYDELSNPRIPHLKQRIDALKAKGLIDIKDKKKIHHTSYYIDTLFFKSRMAFINSLFSWDREKQVVHHKSRYHAFVFFFIPFEFCAYFRSIMNIPVKTSNLSLLKKRRGLLPSETQSLNKYYLLVIHVTLIIANTSYTGLQYCYR